MAATARKPSPASIAKTNARDAYRQATGRDAPKRWTAREIRVMTPTPQPAPVRPAPAPAPVTSITAAAANTAANAAPSAISRAMASKTGQYVTMAAKGAVRGSLVGLGVHTGLSAAVGAYRDGVRGAGRGVVDTFTLGFGVPAYDRKFGEAPKVDINKQFDRSLTDKTVGAISTMAGAYHGANLTGRTGVIAGIGMVGVALGGAVIMNSARKKFLDFKPETDKQKVEAMETMKRVDRQGRQSYSEALAEKGQHDVMMGAAVRLASYPVWISGVADAVTGNPVRGAAQIAGSYAMGYVGDRMRTRGKAMESRATAIDYLARRQSGDVSVGNRAAGQSAGMRAFSKANSDYRAKQSTPGDTFERDRRDPRSGKEIHETVRKRRPQ